MSEAHFDEYEHYNFDHDKHIHSSHSGKQRSKKEASLNTNHFDPSGHSRKILTKLMNTENNKKHQTKQWKLCPSRASVDSTIVADKEGRVEVQLVTSIEEEFSQQIGFKKTKSRGEKNS